ncbi:hypothetical protein TNCV_2808271 [Trichonephila clavipes]|nr:hypothetical protein TNCV_2808271 [Trichonephila clavipes]
MLHTYRTIPASSLIFEGSSIDPGIGTEQPVNSSFSEPLLDSEKFSFMEVVPSGCSRSGNQIQKCPGVRALTPEESTDNWVTGLRV